jgi:hypothetical protein
MNTLIIYDWTNEMSSIRPFYFNVVIINNLYYMLIGYVIAYLTINLFNYKNDAKDELNHSNVRDIIDKLFKHTKNEKDFVSLNTIYKKVYEYDNDITKGLIRSALKYDPPYNIGFRNRKMGYRNIKQI